MVLRGEAGVGKTALLGQTLAAAAAAGLQTARLTGAEPETQLGYAGLHQFLLPFADQLERLPVPQRDALRSTFGLVAGRRRTGSWSRWACRGGYAATVTFLSPRFEVGSGAPVRIGLDGEALTMDPPLVFASRPGALRVRLPRHALQLAPAARTVQVLSGSTIAELGRVAVGQPGTG